MNMSLKTLSTNQIRKLFRMYLSIIELETEDYGVMATEVRHLIGRLGEFYCAIEVGGTLAHVANQHGFDVVTKSKTRISVKTTAQQSGFIAISQATAEKADKLMILQYMNGALSILYFGKMAKAIEAAKYWPKVGRYNLSIAKARRLSASPKGQ